MGIELRGGSCLCAAACVYIGPTLYRTGWTPFLDLLTGDDKGQGELRPLSFELLTGNLGLFGSGMLVDVLFLSVVDAHKGLYRLDDALSIAN